MKKRGISPLIATVLLIGSTIALAALVMVWAQSLFRDTTETQSESTELLLKCTAGVKASIVGSVSCPGPANQLDIIVDNENEEVLEGFIFRVFKGNNVDSFDCDAQSTDAACTDTDYTLTSFSRDTFTIEPSDITGITALEIIPKVQIESGEAKACAQRTDKTFGVDSSCPP